MFAYFYQVLRPRCFNCLKSKFSCIARIPTSNDNVLVGNSKLSNILVFNQKKQSTPDEW